MSRVARVRALAARVSSQLSEYGIRAVLCGGSCVTIYASGRYSTRDLDFVLAGDPRPAELDAALAGIGFRPDPRLSGAYSSPDEEMIVDIRPAPATVGREAIGSPAVVKVGRFRLVLLSPTDCVKDRLAHFYFYGDEQGAEQALLVCTARRVNLAEVERWSRAEGELAKFRVFKERLRRCRVESRSRKRRVSIRRG